MNLRLIFLSSVLMMWAVGNVFAQRREIQGGVDSAYSEAAAEQLNHAIEEYQLMDQMTPGKTELRLNMLALFMKAKRYTDGVTIYEKWGYHPTTVPIELRRKYVGLCFLSHDLEGMRRKLGEDIVLKEPERTQVALHLALYNREWSLARNLYERFEVQHVPKTREAYRPVMTAVEHLHYHHPIVGGLLSLVPGLGLAYNKRPGPAVAMVALVGASGLATWGFARQGEKGLLPAKIFGGLTLSLCAVNIGAGAITSKRYNNDLERHFMQNLDWFTARQF